MDDLTFKHEKLIALIRPLKSVIVAYSGGVDSALLLKVARDVLGSATLAVTADSPSLPRWELAQARRIAESIGARHVTVSTDETRDGNYIKNPPNRCYFCKSELYLKLFDIAAREGISNILNGTNLDDLSDFRPGLQAARERKILSPLADAGLAKADVRALARRLSLEIWDKPSSPCLASRIPYGSDVTPVKLKAIEEAERCIRALGVRELRVRHFGRRARIETRRADFPVIDLNFQFIQDCLRDVGFDEIELREFRSGSLNPVQDAGFGMQDS